MNSNRVLREYKKQLDRTKTDFKRLMKMYPQTFDYNIEGNLLLMDKEAEIVLLIIKHFNRGLRIALNGKSSLLIRLALKRMKKINKIIQRGLKKEITFKANNFYSLFLQMSIIDNFLHLLENSSRLKNRL